MTSGRLITLSRNGLSASVRRSPAGEAWKFDFQSQNRGYVFVAARGCTAKMPCRLHIAFAGCGMNGGPNGGERFVTRAGYIEWASKNNIIVLFPQVPGNISMPNSYGCWGVWGYRGGEFLSRDSKRISAIAAMAQCASRQGLLATMACANAVTLERRGPGFAAGLHAVGVCMEREVRSRDKSAIPAPSNDRIARTGGQS